MADRDSILKALETKKEKKDGVIENGDTWPDGWGRSARHPMFALQLIRKQSDIRPATTAVQYGSIISDITLEHDDGLDVVRFTYETHQGLFNVTIKGREAEKEVVFEKKNMGSAFDSICESKRISIREGKEVDRITIEKLEEQQP